MADIESDIYDIIAEKAAVERAQIHASAKLNDLEIESLDIVEIIFAIEEKFDVNIPFNANDQELEFETVNDVVKAVESLSAEGGAAE
jgi:acyl carrier protein